MTAQQSNGTVVMDMQYVYPTVNKGRISQAIDSVASETVNYSYDGFGNLTGMTGAPVSGADPATNRPNAPGGYDASGLPLGNVAQSQPNVWDVENRLAGQQTSCTRTASCGFHVVRRRSRSSWMV